VLYTFIGPRGDDCGNLFLKISRLTNYKAFTRIEICWPQLAAFCSAQDDNPGWGGRLGYRSLSWWLGGNLHRKLGRYNPM